MLSCDIARPVSRAGLANNNVITAVVAEALKATMRVMAVERAEHRPKAFKVLAWV
jgi:hypothetical protein